MWTRNVVLNRMEETSCLSKLWRKGEKLCEALISIVELIHSYHFILSSVSGPLRAFMFCLSEDGGGSIASGSISLLYPPDFYPALSSTSIRFLSLPIIGTKTLVHRQASTKRNRVRAAIIMIMRTSVCFSSVLGVKTSAGIY